MNKAVTTGSAPTARAILGVPVLPPRGVGVAADRLRAIVGRFHAAMAPPPVRILEGVFGMLDHRVLVVLCELDVPDVLVAPVAPEELARRVGADPVRFERLIRFASTRGWVRIDRRGRVRPTRITTFLRRDHPGGWRAWVDFAGGAEVVTAVASLTTDPESTDGFAAGNGSPFFEWMSDHPGRWATFDRAMAAGGRMHALTLVAAVDWSRSRRVCDVGGGTGDLLAALLDLVPTITGTLFDLPTVVGRSVGHARMTAVGGDAFVGVPKGYDTYLLVNVLHDWADDDARRILSRVAEGAPAEGRIIVVDSDRPKVPRAGMAISADVLMAALTRGGRERATAEFASLGRESGLTLTKTTQLASGDLAHEFRPRRSSRSVRHADGGDNTLGPPSTSRLAHGPP